MGINKRDGKTRDWALKCSAYIADAFPTWDNYNAANSNLVPPNQAYCVRSRFLYTRQGKNKLLDYVQELRTIIAELKSDTLPEIVHVTFLWKILRSDPARTNIFRIHSTTLNVVVEIATTMITFFRLLFWAEMSTTQCLPKHAP